MDSVAAIKARLPIEELVGRYCALQKKGRNFVCLCPFHNDSRPSFLVSPDKGIAYCFACQTGGDIFSFYQAIEGVDFPQALKELAERAGVTLEQKTGPAGPKKDEKERARECLSAALDFYRSQLQASEGTRAYLAKRAVPPEQVAEFEVGFAPDSFSATYEHLLKAGFSRKEILAAGIGVQKELHEERIYDRFRNRLMFPIHDAQGAIVGFGGRTMGNDDAKYVNSSDGILFHKSNVLYGMHHAREAIRSTKNVLLVEGYFDVLACHQAGAKNAVATCGTALTPEHVKLLRRYAESVTLCMDQDRAGQDAMERAFPLLATGGLDVRAIVLPGKDPSDALVADAENLKQLLAAPAKPYLETVLDGLRQLDLENPQVKRDALQKVLRLVGVLPSAVERMDYIAKAGAMFGMVESEVAQELLLITENAAVPGAAARTSRVQKAPTPKQEFSAVEITLGMFLSYPTLLHLLDELIPPQDGFTAALYAALKAVPDLRSFAVDLLDLPGEHRVRVSVLHLFCEENGFTGWSETMAIREIRKNCQSANREMLRSKQEEITRRLVLARREHQAGEEAILNAEYLEVLKLMHKAG